MAFSDSMFMFEVSLEKLTSFINCKIFTIRGQFADVLSLELRDIHGVFTAVPRNKKVKRKSVRDTNSPPKQEDKLKLQCGQAILIVNEVEKLKSDMKNFPIELSLWDGLNPKIKLGSTQIFWDKKYINYLSKIINKKKNPKPVTLTGDYNVFDENTSKRMATVSLKIKLMQIKYGIDKTIASIVDNNVEKNVTDSLLKTQPISNIPFNTKMNIEEFETGIVIAKHNRKQNNRRLKIKNNDSNRNKQQSELTVQDTNKIKYPAKIREIGPNVEQNEMKLNRRSRSLIDITKCPPQSHKIYDSKSRSFTIIKNSNKVNPLNYVFGDQRQSFGNNVYYVGYCTVENDTRKSSPTSGASEVESSGKSEETKPKFKIKFCESDCPGKLYATDSQSHISTDLPLESENLIHVKKCEAIECNAKKFREPPPKADDGIFIELGRPQFAEKVEQVVGGIDAKLKIGNDPCFCSCECTFGFTKKTTYCKVCGGYEKVGEEIVGKHGQLPFPCPIFHKLVDKSKSRTMMSTSGSDSKRTTKTASRTDKQTSESEKSSKKGKRKNKDDRFKFNYGYEAPHIGHSRCAMPCSGTLGTVPKNMGWLWTAEDIPGMKFRPMWKPGATNKHVVRLLRMAKNPGQVMTKKRRRESKQKRSLIRPLLIVHKTDGEYTVTMETMKTYPKPRAINQYPYEDKPLLTYTIGRTEAENKDRRKKKEREQRRLERMQRNFIQSAFRDLCHEICLKTYQQALGILPTTESPDCPCFPAHPGASEANLDVSCSCSEADEPEDASDTDGDEWILEFTPPSAKFDPKFKSKKVIKVDNSSQYTYLDYRVKVLDMYGNPVPRFFKGQDGKQQCSDLGGFWSPEHKWLEINVDGIIGPDGRWAPMTFFGPNGELVEIEGGKFQAANGKWLFIGIDGYVDAQNKWRAYARPRLPPGEKGKKKACAVKDKGAAGDKKAKLISSKPSETFSCFGDVSPKYLSELGIMGHGADKSLLQAAWKDLIAKGEQLKIPERPIVPRIASQKGRKIQIRTPNVYDARLTKCQHPTPSSKGVLAVNSSGDKVYFRLKEPKNKRPNQRLHDLDRQGISLSSFHVPCLQSFINSEMMKKQLRDKIIASNPQNKSVATDAHPANVVYPGNLRPTT